MSDNEELHKSLKKSMGLGKAPIQDKFALMKYTDHSKRTGEALSTRLNRSLAKGEEPHPLDKDMHEAILKHAKPSGHEYSVYSGTKVDAAKVHKPGEVHTTPSHISTSHDISIGVDHAIRHQKGDVAHINHIQVKPKNKVLYLGHVSKHPAEYETVVPAGSKLKYSHTTHHEDHNGNPIDMHHFTVE